MLTVLIVDDDEGVRSEAMRCLASPALQLSSAANGRLGIEQAHRIRPDIVICDIDMPDLTGFEVLQAMRADPGLASTQIMMLSAQGARHSIRLGMELGADDYLTKPFRHDELVAAVHGLIRRRGRLEVLLDTARHRDDTLRQHFVGILAGDDLAARLGLEAGDAPPPDHVLPDATVLFADIRGFTTLAERLRADEVARLLAEYFERVCAPVVAHGGQYLKLLGDGLMAVFPPLQGRAGTPAARAIEATLAMARAAHTLGPWMTTTFPDAQLPAFRVGFGLHRGEVAIRGLGTATTKVATPVGDTVNIAARLESASRDLGWDIVASDAVIAQAGTGLQIGAQATLNVKGKSQPLQVSQVLPSPKTGATDATAGDGTYEKTIAWGQEPGAAHLRTATLEHADAAARAVKDALDEKLDWLQRGEVPSGGEPPRLNGFEILRRLGSGGMSTIHLARNRADGTLVVLKVIDIDPQAREQTARFMREYTLLSGIRHPSVMRIFDQGFSEAHAYIAMEYFENGDLRQRMSGPLPASDALSLLTQVSGALEVIHALGVVHRDLKPENLMVRADGSVVLADFGIAKTLAGSTLAGQTTLTRAGDLVGSPSYMSPEQVLSKPVTPASDLYSLGVLMHELLTGRRPFQGGSMVALLAQHAKTPAPRLPGPLSGLQPLLDQLLAKEPAQRPASARDVSRALLALQKQV